MDISVNTVNITYLWNKECVFEYFSQDKPSVAPAVNKLKFWRNCFLRELRAVAISLVYNICVTVHAMYVEEPYSIQFPTVTEVHNISMYK